MAPLSQQELYTLLEDSPVIAAVKDETGLAACANSEARVLFLLFGTVCNIAQLVQTAKQNGSCVFVHVDLISGLSSREEAVEFIATHTAADGIISTRPALIRRAAALGLRSVQRYFMIDSMAIDSVKKQAGCTPDVVELLPGTMPKIFAKVCAEINLPVIAGGLICDKEDVMAVLRAGACAVSSTNPVVWAL